MHFLRQDLYVAIVPPVFPKPRLMVALSGLAEIAGGLGLTFLLTRRIASRGLVLLLIAVFPANVYMAQHHIAPGEMKLPSAVLWARLAFQPLLIWWVLKAGKD